MNEVTKGRMIEELTKRCVGGVREDHSRYPAMDRALDAKARLEALHQPVPRPTRAALEQNKLEVASRHESGIMSTMLSGFEKHPDVAKASHVGEPTMVNPEPETATKVVQQIANAANGGGDSTVSAETIRPGSSGQIAPNQEAPRSDTGTATADSTVDAAKTPAPDPNELKPNVGVDPNTLPPLQQSNELDNSGKSSASPSTPAAKSEEMADISSSKKKKKKGLSKLNPF